MDWRSHVVQVVAAMPAIGHSKLDKLSAMKCRAAVTMARPRKMSPARTRRLRRETEAGIGLAIRNSSYRFQWTWGKIPGGKK